MLEIGQSKKEMGIRFPEPLFTDDSGYNAQQERSTEEGIVINPEPVNAYMAEIGEFNPVLCAT